MTSKEETTTLLVRMPNHMKAWLEEKAALTLATRNNEIIRCISARMDKEQRERATG
jgi:hypothetical protein